MNLGQEKTVRSLQEYATTSGIEFKDGELTCKSVALPAVLWLGGVGLFVLFGGMVTWSEYSSVKQASLAERLAYELSESTFSYYTDLKKSQDVKTVRHTIPWAMIRRVDWYKGRNKSRHEYIVVDYTTMSGDNGAVTLNLNDYIDLNVHRLCQLMELYRLHTPMHEIRTHISELDWGVEIVGDRLLIYLDHRAGWYRLWIAITLVLLAIALWAYLLIIVSVNFPRPLVTFNADGVCFYLYKLFSLYTPIMAKFAWRDIQHVDIIRYQKKIGRKSEGIWLHYLKNGKPSAWRYRQPMLMPMSPETMAKIMRDRMTGPPMPPIKSWWQW